VVSAPPASIGFLLGDDRAGWRRSELRTVRSWAGPWPVDQQWWEPGAHRRLARFQVVVDDEAMGEQAHLIVAEHRRWFLMATYE
jgi:protein ImuB